MSSEQGLEELLWWADWYRSYQGSSELSTGCNWVDLDIKHTRYQITNGFWVALPKTTFKRTTQVAAAAAPQPGEREEERPNDAGVATDQIDECRFEIFRI